MRPQICGIGWVTPSGIGSGQPGESLDLGTGPLPPLRRRQFLDVPHNRYGRFDLYTKAGFGAIALALRSAGLTQWDHKRPIGLVVGTCRGCLDTDKAYFRTTLRSGSMGSPQLFAYTLPSCVLGEASIQFGLTGPALVIDDPSDGRLNGICTALDLIDWGLCETIVGGWCDVRDSSCNTIPERPCGAVFMVLGKGDGISPWRFERGELMYEQRQVHTIEQVARAVLETLASSRAARDPTLSLGPSRGGPRDGRAGSEP
jgi:hypothetical protein